MSVTVDYALKVNVLEQLEINVDAALAANRRIVHNQYSSLGILDSNTSVPVSQASFFVETLIDGSAVLDLTSLPGINGETISFDGLKVQFLHAKALSNNTNIMIFQGAGEYDLMGASWKFSLGPGQELIWFGNNLAPVVSATSKEIFISTVLESSDAAEISIVAG